MVVGKSLNTGIFDIGEAPEFPADAVPFVVSARRRSKRRCNAINSEDGIAHSCTAGLIAYDFDALYEAVYGGIAQASLYCRLGEIELRWNLVLEYCVQRYNWRTFRKVAKVRAIEYAIRGYAPRGESL